MPSRRADPAAHLLVHPRAFLVNIDPIDPAEYERLLDACRTRAGATA